MAIRVRKFVDREFAKTVDLDLLRRFLAPYAARIGFEWSSLPAGEAEKRDAVFDLFKNADGRFPADLQFALFNISTLSSEAGARILQQHAEERNIELVSHEEIDGPQDARHLNPRHLALRAWLDHPMIFSRALDAVAFLSHSAKVERIGIRQGILPMNDDPKARTGFERAVSAHFSSRYQGRYCDVRWYREHDSVRALVLHGSKASTKNVDANGAEQSLTFREIVQDTIDYNISCGSISVGAKAAPDAKRLVALFAEYLLTDPEFFNHPDAGNIYSLAPINERGADFRFNFEWDENVADVKIREVQVDEGEHFANGRKRYSPWSMMIRDRENALRRMANLTQDLDFADLRVSHARFEFWLDIEGQETRIMVKVVPPGTASFRDHSHERIIMEHLERNGIRRIPAAGQAAAAAE